VIVRPLTGSVIVERAAAPLDARDLAHRLEKLLEDPDMAGPDAAARASMGAGTRIARAVAIAVRQMNEDVREALGGTADLGSIFPIGLAAASAIQVSVSGNLVAVPWYTLVWYSLRSFLSFNSDAIKGSSKEEQPSS
jgi:hypothetical protein